MSTLRAVAVPAEHGGWGFLVEPIVLGLWLAPSAAGALVAVAACGAFLARHPLKLLAADRRRGARYPRTAAAERMALVYAGIAALALLGALYAAPAALWIPLLCAAPLGAVQVFYDARQRSRELAPELAGSVALGATAACVALAGGWSLRAALALWLLLAVRAATSVLYVRARLRLDRGLRPGLGLALTAHALGLLVVGALAWLGDAPWLAVLALGTLLLRALFGLSRLRRPVRPQVLGFQELGFGVITVVLLALGYTFDV